MAIRIEDGRGNGNIVEVNNENALKTFGEVFSIQGYSSIYGSNAYQAQSGIRQVTSPGAYGILALRNDSNKNMIVTYIRVGVDKTEVSQIKCEVCVGGTWNAGTEITPVNMNLGSSKESLVVAHYNSIPTSATTIDYYYMAGPNEAKWAKEGSIVVAKSGILSLKVTTETANANVYGRVSYVML